MILSMLFTRVLPSFSSSVPELSRNLISEIFRIRFIFISNCSNKFKNAFLWASKMPFSKLTSISKQDGIFFERLSKPVLDYSASYRSSSLSRWWCLCEIAPVLWAALVRTEEIWPVKVYVGISSFMESIIDFKFIIWNDMHWKWNS